MIISTWACDGCRIEFDTHDKQEPSCPQCAAKTHWVPAAMNIGHASTKNTDNTMRDLARQTAQQFGMNEGRPVDSRPAEVNISDNQREGDRNHSFIVRACPSPCRAGALLAHVSWRERSSRVHSPLMNP